LTEVAVTDENDQPEPARPAVPEGPAWLHYESEIGEAEVRDLVPARTRAGAVTPGLQRALTTATGIAVLAAIVAAVVFNISHFRSMDAMYGVDRAGHAIGAAVDYTAASIVLIAIVGALVAFAGVWLDVTARTRAVLMTVGAIVMILIGGGVGLFLDPSRPDLLKHYHVGDWGTRASFARLMHSLDTCGGLVAACGLAILILMIVQQRKVRRAYPERSGA
jgi:hypothetical protein